MIHRWMVQCSWKNNLRKLRYLLVFKIINFLKFYKEFRSSLFFIFFIFNWNLVKKINKPPECNLPWVVWEALQSCLGGLAHGFKTMCKANIFLPSQLFIDIACGEGIYPCNLTIFSLCTGIGYCPYGDQIHSLIRGILRPIIPKSEMCN